MLLPGLRMNSLNINFVICKIASFERNTFKAKNKAHLLILWHLYTFIPTNFAVNYSYVQMKVFRLLFFLCSHSACSEEHHHTVWSFVIVFRSWNRTQTRLTNYGRRWVISALCRFGLCGFGFGSFRPNLDSNFVFGLLFINLYRYGRVGQNECVREVRGGFR